ncbi:MAG: winged helix-turn-helix transcriptional regulator [Acidobacteriota bacterium]|nr:MAG: winged helix-turn-helix transcriptional regulator [Acidobacteriota bacterium]
MKALPPEMLKQVSTIFKAMGEPNRLLILQALCREPMCVKEIVEVTAMRQANVSKHLSMLRTSRLVGVERNNGKSIYSLSDPRIPKICDIVCSSVSDRIKESALVARSMKRRQRRSS